MVPESSVANLFLGASLRGFRPIRARVVHTHYRPSGNYGQAFPPSAVPGHSMRLNFNMTSGACRLSNPSHWISTSVENGADKTEMEAAVSAF